MTDLDIFNDPKNFPRLKGSPIFEIYADASSKNPNVFALAITMSIAEGVYVEDQFHLFTQPVLIENDSDYARGADDVMKSWQTSSEILSSAKKK